MEWINKPDHNLDIEENWQEFIRSKDAKVLSDDFGTSAQFSNADFWFEAEQIVIELKEIQTEFLDKHKNKIEELIQKEITNNNLSFNDAVNANFSDTFLSEYVRLVRPAISRILKKANRQIRETKQYLKQPDARGLVVIVNDGFTAFSFKIVASLIANILQASYSSIDGFILMTVNSYVALDNSNIPAQMWMPCYKPDIEKTSLPEFVNELGRNWGDFLEEKLGAFDYREELDNDIGLGPMVYMNRL